jgi:hypothetical protein
MAFIQAMIFWVRPPPSKQGNRRKFDRWKYCKLKSLSTAKETTE